MPHGRLKDSVGDGWVSGVGRGNRCGCIVLGDFMSVHIRGIGPDGQWLTKAERHDMSGDAIARLEAWREAGKVREWQIGRHNADSWDVMLDNFRRRLVGRETTLAAAINRALDAWEAGA